MAMYSWRLGEVDGAIYWVNAEMQERQINAGCDDPHTLHTYHILTRVEATFRDQEKYHEAKQERSLDDLRELAKPWLHPMDWVAQPGLTENQDLPSRDWRLDNINKARWWSKIDMETAARKHKDWNHPAVERLAEDVRYFHDVHDTSDRDCFVWSPYADFLLWFQEVVWYFFDPHHIHLDREDYGAD
jgi:hypothetical protein